MNPKNAHNDQDMIAPVPCATDSSGKINRRDFVKSSIIIASSYAISGEYSVSEAAATKYKLGVSMPKGSSAAIEADSFMAGLKLYFKENTKEAKKIDLILKSIKAGESKDSLKALTDLTINEKVNFLISSTQLESSIQAAHITDKGEPLLMVTNPSVTLAGGEMCQPNIFRSVPNTYQESAILVPWAIKNVGLRTFITGADDQVSNEMGDFFARNCERSGAQFVDRIMLQKDKKNLNDILEAIVTGKPDFVYAAFKGQDAIDFIKGYKSKDRDIKAVLLGPSSLTAYPGVLNQIKELSADIKTVTYLKSPSKLAKRLEGNGFADEVYDISWSASGYDCAAIISEAISKFPGSIASGKDLSKVMAKITVQGARGTIKYDPNRELILHARLQQWAPNNGGFQHTILEDFGENASPDFGCGNIGFPKTTIQLEDEES